MNYFTPDFSKFFKDLAKNNNREWFHENKKRYEQSVKTPFHTFLGDLISEVQKQDKELALEPKDATMRINRDIRFSKDKTPYNLHYTCVVSQGGRKDKSIPGIYLRFSPEGLWLMGGCYNLDKGQLLNVRKAIAANPAKFRKVISDKEFVKEFGEIKGEAHKRVPPEFKEAASNESLILNKQFYFVKELPSDLIVSDQLMKTIMDLWHKARPVNEYLTKSMK